MRVQGKSGVDDDDLDDVRIHQGALISRARLTSHIRTCESASGACNTSCERSPSSSVIWHDYRKLHDKSMVLLSLLALCSEPVDFMAVRRFFV